MRMTSLAAWTLAFGACVTLAGIQNSTASAPKAAKKPMASSAAQITLGKSLAGKNGCNSCHGATYTGKPHFSPSLRANGVTKKYTLAKWEQVMNTGVTEDGGHVNKPMPVYHMTATKSAPLYAFFKSLK